MKKYIKEIIILIIQLFMFYIFPLFAGPTDAMGMVLLIIIATFILSTIMGTISKEKIKHLYHQSLFTIMNQHQYTQSGI